MMMPSWQNHKVLHTKSAGCCPNSPAHRFLVCTSISLGCCASLPLTIAHSSHVPLQTPAESIALENTEDNRRAYRELLVTTPGLGKYISGAILFEETLFQSTSSGKKMTDCLKEQNIVPGIKVSAEWGMRGLGGHRAGTGSVLDLVQQLDLLRQLHIARVVGMQHIPCQGGSCWS